MTSLEAAMTGSDVTGSHGTGNDVTGTGVTKVIACTCATGSRAFFLL